MLNFAGRLVTGLVTTAMLLFSSYQGNDASFSGILISNDLEAVRIRTVLINAFDNDFEQIFRSGSPVVITYTLNIYRNNRHITSETFSNSILYDPLNRYFQIEAEASNNHTFTRSYSEMLSIISEVDIYYTHSGEAGVYRFELHASPENVYLASMEREFNLLMLWKHKTPSVRFNHKVDFYED